jgi:hypothetical protein
MPAADAMVPYVLRKKDGIPRYEALWIIADIQARGCSLRGTPAEKAVREYLEGSTTPDADSHLASSVLMSIETDNHVDNSDSLPPGPCNAKNQ